MWGRRLGGFILAAVFAGVPFVAHAMNLQVNYDLGLPLLIGCAALVIVGLRLALTNRGRTQGSSRDRRP